jgi:hypothetical protein
MMMMSQALNAKGFMLFRFITFLCVGFVTVNQSGLLLVSTLEVKVETIKSEPLEDAEHMPGTVNVNTTLNVTVNVNVDVTAKIPKGMQQPNSLSFVIPTTETRTQDLKARVTDALGNVTTLEALNCTVTTQFRIFESRPYWMMQALDEYGNNKTVGGDEFYVRYVDAIEPRNSREATAVAHVEDLGTGLYKLKFVQTPMNRVLANLRNQSASLSDSLGGIGKLTVDWQYVCNMGRMPPPTKDSWNFGGNFLKQRFEQDKVATPPIRPFVPPIGPDLSQYHVAAFGDSLMRELVYEAGKRRSNILYGTYKAPMNSRTSKKIKNDLERSSLAPKLRQNTQSNITWVLLLGSAIWDILEWESDQGATFDDHLRTVRDLIQHARNTYPYVPIYWKAASALHIHVIPDDVPRVAYMSGSRSKFLYQRQLSLMRELDVPVLDLYEAYFLSGDYTKPGDGRHYKSRFSEELLSWFMPE